jgi:succinyl-CoA synthetase alpha subunit
MTALFDHQPRVVVQGVTGREARMVVRHMLSYGTVVHAGVTPGKQGEVVEGVSVYDTVEDAAEATGGPFDVAVTYVPPLAALDAAAEAIAAGVRLLLVPTENIPLLDAVRLLDYARERDVTVIGPNSVGVISPKTRLKLGAIGGDAPERAFVPGRVGVMSRSGGLTAEVGLQLRRAGLGVSTAVSIGGDAMIGTTPARLYTRFAEDPDTEAVVYVGEPGTLLEEDLAAEVEQRRHDTPLIAVVPGDFLEDFPHGTAFGHAGAVIEARYGSPREKRRVLAEAGAHVAERFDDVVPLVLEQTILEVR